MTFEVEAETREHLEWLMSIYTGRVHSYGFDPTAARPYYCRIESEKVAT